MDRVRCRRFHDLFSDNALFVLITLCFGPWCIILYFTQRVIWLLYPTQLVAEDIMFLTRPSVSQSVSPSVLFLPVSPKAKAGLGVQSLRPSVRPSVHLTVSPSINFSHFHLLFQNHRDNFNQTWHKASFCEGDSSLFKWRALTLFKGR